MVGPSLTDEDRQVLNDRIRLAFVLVVAVSGGMTGVWAGGSVAFVVAGVLAGVLLGGVLVWYLAMLGQEVRLKSRNRPGDRQREPPESDQREDRKRRRRP